MALSGVAQEQHKNYNRTVFNNVSRVTPEASQKMQALVASEFPGWRTELDARSGVPRDLYGPAIAVSGGTLAQKADYVIEHQLADLGVAKEAWQQTGSHNSSKAAYVNYQQVASGHKVAFAHLNFRFTFDGKLVRTQVSQYGTPDASLQPQVSADAARKTSLEGLDGATVTAQEINSNWEWFPVPSAEGYTLHPSWPFTITGTEASGEPLEMTGYVDAITGSLLYRSSSIHTADITVRGTVYNNGNTQPASLQPLANLLVTSGGTNYYTNAAGLVTVPTATLPANVSVQLSGRWSRVYTGSTFDTPAFTDTVTTNVSTYEFPTVSPSSSRHINAYYHTNKAHDFMKSFFPTFTGMDMAMPTRVDVTGGTCNAFYNNGNFSINFYAAGGGCPSFAEIPDIVYHEYGHGISYRVYNAFGANFQNGGLGEGNSDVWAMGITHSPIIGANSLGNSSVIRRYDLAPKVYPADITGEVHANGEIIAGAWWDVAVNLNNVDSMMKLFAEVYYDVPNAPEGFEGPLYRSILVSALLNDDNDNNINNGTPHLSPILRAFARHGIFLLGNATYSHQEVANQPANTPVTVSANLSTNYGFLISSFKMFYKQRTATTWDSVTLANNSGTYTGQIPGQAAGSVVDYYFALRDTLGYVNSYYPNGFNPSGVSSTSNIPYQFGVGLSAKVVTNFETALTDWTIGNAPAITNRGVAVDNATSGIWVQAVPLGTNLTALNSTIPCQTGADHTSGSGQCLVTGNSASANINSADVDNGGTSVLTPYLDLSGYTNPVIEYYRWYTNNLGDNPGNDYWEARIWDSAAPGFVPIRVDYTNVSDNSWRRRIFKVSDVLAFQPSKKIQIRFNAADNIISSVSGNGQSTVEAAIDDFVIYDLASTTGVNPVAVERANIYPNPANNQLQIVLPSNGFEGDAGLYDLAGRKIAGISLQKGTASYTLPTANIAAGTYMLMIHGDKMIQSHKVVISH